MKYSVRVTNTEKLEQNIKNLAQSNWHKSVLFWKAKAVLFQFFSLRISTTLSRDVEFRELSRMTRQIRIIIQHAGIVKPWYRDKIVYFSEISSLVHNVPRTQIFWLKFCEIIWSSLNRFGFLGIISNFCKKWKEDKTKRDKRTQSETEEVIPLDRTVQLVPANNSACYNGLEQR